MQRRLGEEKLVDFVLRAIFRKLLQVEYLAHRNSNGGDDYPVPGLVGFIGLIRPHFATPGVSADCGDILLPDPVAGFECHARRIAAAIARPVFSLQAALLMTGTNDDEIALADFDALLFRASIEIGIGDRITIVERLDALEPGNIQ